MEWHKSDVALKKLKQMLWGLEALRVFKDKLQKALQALQKARDKMNTKIKQVSTLRLLFTP